MPSPLFVMKLYDSKVCTLLCCSLCLEVETKTSCTIVFCIRSNIVILFLVFPKSKTECFIYSFQPTRCIFRFSLIPSLYTEKENERNYLKDNICKSRVRTTSNRDCPSERTEDLMDKEKLNQDSKKEVVVVNGDKYVVNGSKMDKVVSPSIPKKKEDVCLTFCKYGSCSNPTCRNRHDPSLVRICPAFLRV